MRHISRVVSEKSTSCPAPAEFIVGRAHSAFFATQGMTDTQTMRRGSTPSLFAK